MVPAAGQGKMKCYMSYSLLNKKEKLTAAKRNYYSTNEPALK